MNTIEVHNVYTLYETEADGSIVETPILGFRRPQDWGDSLHWHYHQCRLQFSYAGTEYINNCHVYQQIERNSIEAFKHIAPYLFMVMIPGTPKLLAGRAFLDEDDFWHPAWGELPPYYERDDEDY